MKNIRKIKSSFIFVRLMITFICILVPLYTLSIQIYTWGTKKIKEEIATTANKNVLFYLNDFELEIQRMKLIQYDCMGDDNLSSLAVSYQIMDDYERYHTIWAVIQRLRTIKSSSRYIEDVRVHIPSINKTLSAENGVCDFMDDEFNTVRSSNPETKSQLIYDSSRILIPASYPTPLYTVKRKPMFILVIELSPVKFLSTIKQLVNYSDGGSILIFQPNNYIINSDESNSRLVKNILLNDTPSSADKLYSRKVGKKTYSIVYAASEYLGWTLVEFIPESIMFKSIARYHFLLIILIASSGVIISIYSMMTYKSVHQPLKSLVEAFKKVQKGKLDIRLKHQYNNEFGYIYIGFNSMIENINSLIEQVYKKEIFKQQAELKHLQSQINPHFLYNSFFILRSIIHNEEYDKAEDFVQKLGDYFQFITRSGKDFIPLSTEVGHAKVYTEIQMTRFSNRINMTFEALPEKYSNIYVPRLILQPIIENVFEHGLKNKLADGILQITFAEQENKLLIKVEDNGDELLDEDLQKLQNSIRSNDDIETTGIINIHRRLQIKLGSESGLSVSRSELGGLAIIINISLTHSSVTYTQSASLENKSL